MPHKRHRTSHDRGMSKSQEKQKIRENARAETLAVGTKPKLELVLKCDSTGSVEAVTDSILQRVSPVADILIISSGVGNINKSDILIAETGSRLIAGFQVDLLPGIEEELKEHGVEVRLYDVIYKLTEDIRWIAEHLIPPASQEEVVGTARVIALFKSSRRGIIIGCEILDGYLAQGKRFRLISAMGPVYSGAIESMQIERKAVQKATRGAQLGIKIRDFKNARIGDLVESFQSSASKRAPVWRPRAEVIQKRSE